MTMDWYRRDEWRKENTEREEWQRVIEKRERLEWLPSSKIDQNRGHSKPREERERRN